LDTKPKIKLQIKLVIGYQNRKSNSERKQYASKRKIYHVRRADTRKTGNRQAACRGFTRGGFYVVGGIYAVGGGGGRVYGKTASGVCGGRQRYYLGLERGRKHGV
jgi:hypothetical protein